MPDSIAYGRAMMKRALDKAYAPAYAALRIVSGLLFACHGAQKIFGWFGAGPLNLSDKPQLWIGGLIELLAGAAMAFGLFTRWAALLSSGTMAVAYFQYHFAGRVDGLHWAPIVNKGELAVVYSFLFLFFATQGAGAASLDRVLDLDP